MELDKTLEEYGKRLYEELRFDKYNLDSEYEEQPRRYMDWALLYGKALLERRKAEDEMDTVRGQVDLEVREFPGNFSLTPDSKGKVMETAIKSAVNVAAKVVEVREKFYRIYELCKLFEHATVAFVQRKELLKGEGDLWINKYYSAVTVKEKAQTEKSKGEIDDDLRNHRRRSL